MNELALFAGAGGGLLASKLLGWTTKCAVELDEYCRCVLIRRQNERILSPAFPIWDDICSFDGRPWRGFVDIVTGGFPCQAFSTAARGRNNASDLWPEMFRVIREASPYYVFAENVSERAIEKAALDCRSLGFKTIALPLSAADLGADHIRERYWLLAYTDNKGELLRRFNAKVGLRQEFQESFWETFPENTRMDDGLSNRVDRYKATGNGQVPIVAATAFKILTSIAIQNQEQK